VHGPDLEGELREGIRLEQALRWEDAERLYRRALETPSDARSAATADLRLRHANALLQLQRLDEARNAFDEALTAAIANGEPPVLARALLGAGVFAASRGDLRRGEDFLLAALDRFHEVHDREGLQGEGWALLNLAAIYGKSKRLDLAFLTFDKARERLFAVENWVGVATAWELQAELRGKLGDADRAAQDFHEAMSFYGKQGMEEKVAALREKLGGRRVV
jgi:tetratricopeptide (TPR) repeat protein